MPEKPVLSSIPSYATSHPEENIKNGGFGEKVLEYYNETEADVKVLQIALPDDYIEHGNVEILKKEACIDAESIFKKIIAQYRP